jgi:hypothetical protein
MPLTERGVNSMKVFVISPSQPRLKPKTLMPLKAAILVTARMAAFIPGASPPVVTTPILLNSLTLQYYRNITVTETNC